MKALTALEVPNPKLSASLEDAMNRWLNETCEEDYRPTAYYPDALAHLMAQAALVVLQSVDHHEQWLRDQGYVEHD